MERLNSVVIVSAVRTAIGSFGGSLKGHGPTQLASLCIAEAMKRGDIEAGSIGHSVFGNVIHTEPRDMYLARAAACDAGVPFHVPAMTLNRLCGSGLQAVITASQAIAMGDVDCAVAGGAEVMSRAPLASQVPRWGAKMGDVVFTDMMAGALTDPFGNGHMGVTAENIARRYAVGRSEQDELAAESHRRAASAIESGRFREQIVGVAVRKGRHDVVFDRDEHVRPDTSAESLSGLRPAFDKQGSVTAGNASGVNDGAAALVLMGEDRALREDRRPLARVVGYAHAGVDPSEMSVGPVPATRALLARTGLRLQDFDVIESNEAFAAQACFVARELDLDPLKTNPNGGAIALGHPIGATGAILLVKLVHELRRTGGRYGLVTMCIGGGQGISLAVEAIGRASAEPSKSL